MSQLQFEGSPPGNDDEDDSQVDFCNLSTRSLQRPSDHYIPPPRKYAFTTRLLRDPLTTAFTQFSKVTNFVLNPYYDDDYFLWHSPRDGRHHHSSGDRAESSRLGASYVHRKDEARRRNDSLTLPPPALPSIECSTPQHRLPLLTETEFEETLSKSSKKEILERVFRGGIATHSLRRKLWPLILGLTDNLEIDWSELKSLYDHYHKQWTAILPDQESRFTAYRERKNLIDRDVIRCDRTHSFFANSSENLDKLQELLMTYIMYDFDTGYVQGMSDLASPLLYVWEGDVTKAFWCFVSIMKLFRRNFEMTQNSISNQLTALMKLIKITDPVFAQYLSNNESDNCYFAFRWLICLFKREFMKSKTDEYDDCLIVWETIWSLHNLASLDNSVLSCSENPHENSEENFTHHSQRAKDEEDLTSIATDPSCSYNRKSGSNISIGEGGATGNQDRHCLTLDEPEEEVNSLKSSEKPSSVNTSRSDRDSVAELMEKLSQRLNMDDLETLSLNQEAHSIESTEQAFNCHQKLENVELFCLCICLAIIRRERDLILANKLEASEILKHFNQLHLNDCLNNILLHAMTIWHWLKNDGGERLLYSEEEKPANTSVEDFDLLNDEDCQPFSPLSV